MFGLETYLNPLWRPPLALAVTAGALKYVATLLILEDPVLRTKSDFVRSRQDDEPASRLRRRRLFLAQLAFYGLAAHFFVADLQLFANVHHMPFVDRVHIVAFMLAFSPNTVVAVACVFSWVFRRVYLKNVPYIAEGICLLSDTLATLFMLAFLVFYILPLVLVFLTYGTFGMMSVSVVLVWDLISLPVRIFRGHVGALWLAVPISLGISLSYLLNACILVAQVCLFRRMHPELAARSGAAEPSVVAQARVPVLASARVIGSVGSLIGMGSVVGDAQEEEREAHLIPEAAAARRAGALSLEPGGVAGGGETCILNDEYVAGMAYMRLMLCTAVPLLQLTVVVAAKVWLGGTLWHAAESTFAERSWSHYQQHVRDAGSSAIVPLLWYYL